MRYLGILLADALILLMVFFSHNFKDESAGRVCAMYAIGLVMFFAWSMAMYLAIMLIVRG